MPKYITVLACCCFIVSNLKAQSAEDSVKKVINKMFVAMKNADANSLAECFADSAILQSVSERNGKVTIMNEPVKSFVDFVGTTTKGDADEQITFDMVKTDGALATAWTPYKFYLGTTFSHCGVNFFQLARTADGWKIIHIAYTIRKDNCIP
jgi:ketosteroid isomerase-like protein